MIDTLRDQNMAEDIVKGRKMKHVTVTFSTEINVFDIPLLTDETIRALFYTKDEISLMKDEALMERAGVAGSVASTGDNLFEALSEYDDSKFSRKSLQKASSRDVPSMDKTLAKSRSNEIGICSTLSVTPEGAEIPTLGVTSQIPEAVLEDNTGVKAAPRTRERRERGTLNRTRSGTGPRRTDRGGGRGSAPRRARSSMAAINGNTNKLSTLEAMQKAALSSKPSG